MFNIIKIQNKIEFNLDNLVSGRFELLFGQQVLLFQFITSNKIDFSFELLSITVN
jgi:hypothetical protein